MNQEHGHYALLREQVRPVERCHVLVIANAIEIILVGFVLAHEHICPDAPLLLMEFVVEFLGYLITRRVQKMRS